MKNVAISLATAVVLAAGIAGCGADNSASNDADKSESVGTARQAWDTTTCINATPDYSFPYTGYHMSGATYNNAGCYKSEVIEYDDLSMGTETYIAWEGTTPTCSSGTCTMAEVTACEATWFAVAGWSFNSSTFSYDLTVNVQRYGYVLGGPGNEVCEPPDGLVLYPGAGAGHIPNDTRTVFAVTARPSYGSSTTNPYWIDAY